MYIVNVWQLLWNLEWMSWLIHLFEMFYKFLTGLLYRWKVLVIACEKRLTWLMEKTVYCMFWETGDIEYPVVIVHHVMSCNVMRVACGLQNELQFHCIGNIFLDLILEMSCCFVDEVHENQWDTLLVSRCVGTDSKLCLLLEVN